MNAVDAITTTELSKAAALFGTMKQLRIQLKSADEATLDRAFEQHVQSVLEKLDQRLPSLIQQNQEHSLSDSQTRQLLAVEVIMARHGLYDAAFQQVVMLCQTIAPGFGDSVRELRSVHSSLLTELQHSFCEVANDNLSLSNELNSLQSAASVMQSDVVSLQDVVQTLNAENEDYKKRVLDLRKNLREATQQVAYLKEAASSDPKTIASAAVNGPGNAANAPVNTLLSFNHAYMNNTLDFETPQGASMEELMQYNSGDNLNSSQRKRSSSVTRSPVGVNASNNASSASLRRTGSAATLNTSRSNNNLLGNTISNTSAALPGEWNSSTKDSAIRDDWMNDGASVNNSVMSSPSRATNKNNTILNAAQKGGLSIVAPVNWLLIFRAEVQKALDEGRSREMTLNEVTETIQKLYQSKVIANEKASRGIGNVPLETMEQHVFRTYEAKYGLRSIAVEHAGALLRSLLKHSSADNEVMVFLKIFRNELEEEFRFIQSELFTSIKDLTMVQMLSRYPNKDQNSINALLEQKMNSGVVYEDEWMDMVNYLYNPADASTVCLLLKNIAVAERAKIGYFDSPGGVNKAPLSANSNKIVSKPNTNYVLESNVQGSVSIGYDKRNKQDVKRLGYASPTLQITVKDNINEKRKDMYKVPFSVFLRTILDFQLQSHLQYLNNFVRVFRDMDLDVDGVINAAEFQQCFLLIRRGNTTTSNTTNTKSKRNSSNTSNTSANSAVTEEEMSDFLALIVEIDPMQSDRITFSSAVTCLSKMKP